MLIFFFLLLPKEQSNEIKLKYATWGSQTEIEILTPMLKEFERQNPSIKIELMHIPQNYFQKIHLLFASNSAPDVVFINNLYLPFFANAGVLNPITNYPQETEPKALAALSFDNQIYAVPRDISVLVLFRNKDLFKKCKVDLDNTDLDFEKFLSLTQKFKSCNVFGISFEENPPLFYLPYLMSNGGGILSDDTKTNIFDSKNSQKGVKFYTDLRTKYHVAPTASESANMTMAQLFLNGKLAMHLTGHWLVPKYEQEAKFDWDTITFPKGDVGSVVSLDASGWAISKSSKHKKEAQKLIEFLSSKENILKFTQSGLIVPARKDILNGEFQTKSFNKAFVNAIKTAKPTPVSTDYVTILDGIKRQTNLLFNQK
ncbi:sugar ABC transporter substrate-binding protein [bacterium]|nr:sugar ABC transporter substrate-binding protein [bacterium]